MKQSKTSLVMHILGVVLLIVGFALYGISQKLEPVMIALIGLTLIWLIALEQDVYAKDQD